MFMVAINSINSNNYYNKNAVSFKKNSGLLDKPRKCAIATSSLLIPGLGQTINGQNIKGVSMLAAWGTVLWSFFTARKNPNSNLIKIVSAGAWAGLAAWSANDAYKNS